MQGVLGIFEEVADTILKDVRGLEYLTCVFACSATKLKESRVRSWHAAVSLTADGYHFALAARTLKSQESCCPEPADGGQCRLACEPQPLEEMLSQAMAAE